ncbi:MAG: hypothetical protein RLZZ94_928 [Bacteroidota bacterium]
MLFDDTYLSIKEISTGDFRDRGSKFLAFAYPIKSESEVKEIIQQLKKEHPQANHHCYAFRLSPDPTVYRASDDREPSGSAGKPILAAIQSQQLTNVLIVVVRYFGGSLLGVPGLINAYRTAAAEALSKAKIIEHTINDKFEITFDFESINDVHSIIKSEGAIITEQTYETPCIIQFELRKSKTNQLLNKLKNHPTLAANASWKLIY